MSKDGREAQDEMERKEQYSILLDSKLKICWFAYVPSIPAELINYGLAREKMSNNTYL
jgi:hypothetical protein